MAKDDASGRKPGAKRPRASRQAKQGASGAKRTRSEAGSAAKAGKTSKSRRQAAGQSRKAEEVAGRTGRQAAGEAPAKPPGERFVPGEGAPLPAYEHTHRYVLAAALLGGRRVLDLACGSGTGTQRLRDARIETVALDLDRTCARRSAPGVCADAAQLPFPDSLFGGVVCFEAIEHLVEPERLLAEVARVLAPGGLAVISTPDREIFRESAGRVNPYHVSEMSAAEFDARLREHFGHVAILGQSVWSGSWMTPLGDGRPVQEVEQRVLRVAAERVDVAGGAPGAPWVDPARDLLPTPMFLVAICAGSRTALRTALREVRAGHLLHDPRQSLLGHYFQSMERQVEGDKLIASHAEHARNLERIRDEQRERIKEVETHSANLQRLTETGRKRLGKLETHLQNLESRARERSERIEELEVHAGNLESFAHRRDERIEELEESLAAVERAYEEARKHSKSLARLSEERGGRVQELEAVVAALESERSEQKGIIESLRSHAEILDRERAATQDHAENLLQLAEERLGRVNELERHTTKLEHRLTTAETNEIHLRAKAEGLASYSANLEAERDDQTARIEQLVEQTSTLETSHAAVSAEKQELEVQLQERAERLQELAARLSELQAAPDEARPRSEPPEELEREATASCDDERLAAAPDNGGLSPGERCASSPSAKPDAGSS